MARGRDNFRDPRAGARCSGRERMKSAVIYIAIAANPRQPLSRPTLIFPRAGWNSPTLRTIGRLAYSSLARALLRPVHIITGVFA